LINYRALWANPLLLMLKRGPLPTLDGKQPEDGDKAQAEELWAKAVLSKRTPVMISSDDALIQVTQ
jgi:hypothetical protein